MANISTEKLYLKTGTQFTKVIKYSKGMFHAQLPDELCQDLLLKDLKDKSVYGDTEAEVNKLFKEKLTEWANAKTNITKVIVFKAAFQGALAKKSFKSRWDNGYTPSYRQSGIHDGSDLWEFIKEDISHSDRSLGMTIQWAVYDKESFKQNVKYKWVSGRPFDDWHLSTRIKSDKCTEIEWTQDREQFFLSLDESFATMISKVYKALGDLTPEKLSFLADSKLKLIGQ